MANKDKWVNLVTLPVDGKIITYEVQDFTVLASGALLIYDDDQGSCHYLPQLGWTEARRRFNKG